ncbi:MAG: DUF3164 family protein [Ramlibacter sp.]|nr:DUF3164 family protein [Ramlibacter sp.]
MTEVKTTPAGYWEDAQGNLVPTSKIKDIDKDRSKTVRDLCTQAKKQSEALLAFKLAAMQAVADFVERSLAEYDVKTGGAKGNVTLLSFDGRHKITRQVAENLVFDERLQAAKALIDECIHTWSKGSNDNIKVLVNQAFQVDKAGKINTGRVLALRSLKITDEKWLQAMQAISDSTRVASTKAYVRFYERDDASGEYVPIVLDVAGV